MAASDKASDTFKAAADEYLSTLEDGEKNATATAALVAELEKAAGIKLTLSDKDADIDTGFVLSAENYDVEFSVDAILDEVFEQNEKAIADILFNTGDVK
jgi:vacuolar-type H+-ATPase subunit E/Vma4